MYPVLSLAAAKAYEDSVLKRDPDLTASAMLNAGEAIGRELLQDFRELGNWPAAAQILVLAGKGLNTGDALIACETVRREVPGLRVTLVLTAEQNSLNPIAGAVLKRLKENMGECLELLSTETFLSRSDGGFDVVLDGLYGLGFRPPLRDDIAGLLNHVNNMDGIRLRASIDLPSGMGETSDPDTFRADLTYIPGVAKAPVFSAENSPFVGRIRFLEIDPFLEQSPEEGKTFCLASRNAHKALNRIRQAQSDKRSYGHCLLIAGSVQMPGAALMATMGALKAGAGLVTTCTPMTVATQIAPRVPEAMWRALPLSKAGGFDLEVVRIVSLAAAKADAVLIGPGLVLDRATVFILSRIVREIALPMVIDASALTQDITSAILGRPLSAGAVVLTPHLGEFRRISGLKHSAGEHASLMDFSRKYRVVTVLKGSPNMISDGRRVIAVPVGGPVLARGGAGDILSGMLTCLLSQNPDLPVDAAVKAVSWHGAAADSLARESGSIAVNTTELLPHLTRSLRA